MTRGLRTGKVLPKCGCQGSGMTMNSPFEEGPRFVTGIVLFDGSGVKLRVPTKSPVERLPVVR